MEAPIISPVSRTELLAHHHFPQHLSPGHSSFLIIVWFSFLFFPEIFKWERQSLGIFTEKSWKTQHRRYWSFGTPNPVAQTVKSLPAVRETWVQSLAQEYSPGEWNGNPLQYSCLENITDQEPGGLQSMGFQRVGHDLATKQQLGYLTSHHLCFLNSKMSITMRR